LDKEDGGDMGLIELSLWDKLKRIKADKVVGAVEGNFAKLDANGNLVDSGHKDADYEDADATILKEADVVDSLDSTSTKAPLSANQGKVLKDAVDPIEARLDTTELTLTRQGQDLASVKQTLQQGNGATLDFSDIGIVPLDARATGRANPTVEGRTATNLVENGDFSDGTTGWVSSRCVLSTSEGIAYATGDGSDGISYFQVGRNIYGLSNSDHLFSRARFRVRDSVCRYITLILTYPNNVEVMRSTSPVQDQWYVIDGIDEMLGNGLYSVKFLAIYADATTANGKVMEIDGNYGVSAYNLTATFGAGNEPDLETCQKLFSNYFSGTKSIQLPARLRSVGKNLFDMNKFSQGTISVSTGQEQPSTIRVRTNFIRMSYGVNTNISFQSSLYAIKSVYWYDKTGTYIGGTSNTIVPLGAYYMRVIFGLVSDAECSLQEIRDIAKPQLELGSTATPYEPYTDSTLYIADNEEVRSVPAISDEVKVVNGQLVKVQNVSEDYTIPANFTLSKDTSPTTLTFSQSVRTIFDGKPTTISSVGFILSTLFRSASFSDLYGNTLDDEAISWTDDSSSNRMKLWIRINRSRLTTEDASGFNSWITATLPIIQYQLATPITNNLLTSGILQAKPNGTVYFEPYYEGSHQTNVSSQITLPYEGTIDKLTGYDENLEPYEVPSTGYTLVGTLLTITGALENEVFYVELSRTEPLAPEMGVNVINNEQVIEDTSNGKFYKLVPTITNGVLVGQTPVEVV